MPHQLSDAMRQCLKNCSDCSAVCQETLSHCLGLGGPHAEAAHIGLLLDCAELCAASANFMARGSSFHSQVCGVCASICEQCAQDCERFDDDQTMGQCAQTCRRCAESCRKMAA